MKHLKVLHVVRHAKSSWDNNDVADIDRPLKSKGIRNAYDIARRLKLGELAPQRIISSPANRALHTAIIFARVLEYPLPELEINNILYDTSTERVLEMIRGLDDACKSVMIFGHNPVCTDLVNLFIKSPVDNVPTSGSVTLQFGVSNWKEIDRSNLDRQLFSFPNGEE